MTKNEVDILCQESRFQVSKRLEMCSAVMKGLRFVDI